MAGADLVFSRALYVIMEQVGLPKAQALRMATGAPAQLLTDARGFGRLVPGQAANALWMSDDFSTTRAL